MSQVILRRADHRSVAVLVAFLVAACASCTPSVAPASVAPSTAPSSVASSSAAPSASPAPSVSQPPEGSVIVTLKVAGDQQYRILLTDPADIAGAIGLLQGDIGPSIPNGKVVRHAGEDPVNRGYTWSIDPNDFEWADVTTEVCDGIPSDVEQGLVTSDRYCPWSAIVVAVDPL
jgi:hypothetical protein